MTADTPTPSGTAADAQQAATAIADNLTVLEERLGAPPNFLLSLVEESDWGLVIKAHAFLESQLADALARHADPRLVELFAKASMQGVTGKLKLARQLELLGPEAFRFAERFSGLRNRLTHDVGQLRFHFATWFGALAASEAEAWAVDATAASRRIWDTTVPTPANKQEAAQQRQSTLAMTRDNVRLTMALGVLGVVHDAFYRTYPEYERPKPLTGGIATRVWVQLFVEEMMPRLVADAKRRAAQIQRRTLLTDGLPPYDDR